MLDVKDKPRQIVRQPYHLGVIGGDESIFLFECSRTFDAREFGLQGF